MTPVVIDELYSKADIDNAVSELLNDTLSTSNVINIAIKLSQMEYYIKKIKEAICIKIHYLQQASVKALNHLTKEALTYKSKSLALNGIFQNVTTMSTTR